ncbi:hypothetical protein X927_01655 [Petrotoga mexicana DSM 14811]|uniref:Uncharacterized protein n=2 Tax=Petrotoga TaxID=28236 RepID=A0A2K1PDV0_9BACT|nr:hypothetical protein X928_05525 [Petrotoga miotherma DSM 10691]PNS00970.1 hypothetical protein X927_01655 [Petrotoga mexicana DSM 14811]
MILLKKKAYFSPKLAVLDFVSFKKINIKRLRSVLKII